jgi:type IV secretion system protein VirD4
MDNGLVPFMGGLVVVASAVVLLSFRYERLNFAAIGSFGAAGIYILLLPLAGKLRPDEQIVVLVFGLSAVTCACVELHGEVDERKGIATKGWRGIVEGFKTLPQMALLFVLTFVAWLIGFYVGVPVAGLIAGDWQAGGTLHLKTFVVLGAFISGIVLATWRFYFLFRTREGGAEGIGESISNTISRVGNLTIGIMLMILGGLWVLFCLYAVPWTLDQWIVPLVPINGAGRAIVPFIGAVIGLWPSLAGVRRVAVSLASRPKVRTDTHGQGRTATEGELRQGGLIPRKDGIYLGRFLNDGRLGKEVGYPGGVHLITIGPAGSGKGTGLIIPNLKALKRSIFIIDPKGEAAAVTARERAKLGPVKIINPFSVLVDERPYLKSTGFNPLAALDRRDDNFTDDCVGIAQALVREEVGSDGAFFSGSAQDLLTALVMYEKMWRREDANLANVRNLLTEPYGEDAQGKAVGLAATVKDMVESRYEPLKSKAGRFMVGSKSTMDIISTAGNETRLLDSPSLQRDLSGEAIDWNLMKREITTVYLILPADRLETHANYLRLVVTSALRTLLRSPPSATLPPVLFMLDEFAQLGYLPQIENAMAIARGFGIQLWPFLHDLNQLHTLYKNRWQTFLGQRGVPTAFAPQDMFTAEHLSRLCGQKTVIIESENERIDESGMGRTRGPQGVPLFRPEELMAMPAGQLLCLVSGVDSVKNPFFTNAQGYWETAFDQGLDKNPYSPQSTAAR